MKRNSLIFQLVFRILFLAFLLFMLAFIGIKNYWFSFTFVSIITIISITEIIHFSKNYLSKNQKIIDALLYNDFSLNINQNQYKKDNNNIFR